MKNCIKCNENKPLSDYGIHTSGKYRNVCKQCSLSKRKNIIRVHPILNEFTCIKCKQTKSINEFNKNKRDSLGIVRECKICRADFNKKIYEKKKDQIKKRTNEYYHKNKEKLKETRRIYSSNRGKTDLKYKLSRRLRNRLYYALRHKSWKKNTKFSEYIGCNLNELKDYLESKFTEGMTWENYGDWHIDHIVPLISAKNEQELYKLCHYTNLSPKWAIDNIKKGAKVVYEVKEISNKETHPFLLEIHYAKRIPPISFSYGLFLNDVLIGVVTYGKPVSSSLRNNLAGKENAHKIFELNRLCLKYNLKNEASMLVGKSLRLLPKDLIIVSFADTAHQHIGIVYQATNFKYYGITDKKRDWALKSHPHLHSHSIADLARDQHNRSEYLKQVYGEDFYIRDRSRKHRYIFITGKNKDLFKSIKYKELPYPKKS